MFIFAFCCATPCCCACLCLSTTKSVIVGQATDLSLTSHETFVDRLLCSVAICNTMVHVSSVLHKIVVNTPKQLYKHLMRDCEKLPKDAIKHYKHSIRQSFRQHVDEQDPVRVKQIMERALLDAEWILNKYSSQKS